MQFYVSQTKILTENGKVTGVEFQKNKLGEPDASGRRRPVPIPGSEFTVHCDTVIPAIGQAVDKKVMTADCSQWRQCNKVGYRPDRIRIIL